MKSAMVVLFIIAAQDQSIPSLLIGGTIYNGKHHYFGISHYWQTRDLFSRG